MEDFSKSISCATCGMVLEPESTAPCPKCGEQIRCIGLKIADKMESFHDGIKGVVNAPSLRSKKRKRIRFMSGDEQRRSRGDFVDKERVIDRDNDRYYERVTDKATGETQEAAHRLSDHVGHGSDKWRGPL